MSDGINDGKTYNHAMTRVRSGQLYRHYKGGLYAVIGVGKDNDDRYDPYKRKVFYMSLDDGETYHRDLKEFVEHVWVEGKEEVSRFKYTGTDVQISTDVRGGYSVTRKY